MTKEQDSQPHGLDQAKVPAGYLTAADVLSRLFLREVGLVSALGSVEARWLLDELEAGKADLKRRAASIVYYSESDGDWVTHDDPLDRTERARDTRRRQLAEIWYAGRARVWQAFLNGSLRARRVRDDGRLEDISPAHFNLNVEDEVFELGALIWPKRGMLVVAEHAFKRWMRSVASKGPTSPPAGAADRPIDHAMRRPGPKPGTIRRWAAKDRALYPRIKALLAKGLSLTGAVMELAKQGKVAGIGTDESRARRLYNQYKEDEKLGPTRSH